jgi:hypothetical protein
MIAARFVLLCLVLIFAGRNFSKVRTQRCFNSGFDFERMVQVEERYEFDFAAEETPMTDDEILDAVEQVLENDERVDITYIEVFVENGVVYLEGAVASEEEKEMVDSLLDNIEGISVVQNNLQVVPSGYTPDDTLAGSGDEEEFEGVEVLSDKERQVSEDASDAIEEGRSYVPPNEPVFPTERGEAAERMRKRRAEEESTGETSEPL